MSPRISKNRSGGQIHRAVKPGRKVSRRPMRGQNINRINRSQQRLEANRQQARRVVRRPSPAVRPGRPPQRVMPRRNVPIQRYNRPSVTRQAARRSVQAGSANRPNMAAMTVASAAVPAVLVASAQALQYSLNQLQSQSDFQSMKSDLVALDNDLQHALQLLESARDAGYRYQGDLETVAQEAYSQWQQVKGSVDTMIAQANGNIQPQLGAITNQVQQLNRLLASPQAESALRNTQTQVNSLLSVVSQQRSKIENAYTSVDRMVDSLTARLNTVHWALKQLSEATWKTQTGEDLVMAVPARWDQEGDDDPEGVLYLTNKNLVFERKEKVATKKVLFLTVASELVQQTLIQQPMDSVKATKAQNKGLFGHQDFLEVQFSDAKLGTVPFHLNGQPADAWAGLIERTRNGKIEEERSTGSGISLQDMTAPLDTSALMSLQNETNQLQEVLMLQNVRDEVDEVSTEVGNLTKRLSDLRARGYAVDGDLEPEISLLTSQWERTHTNVEKLLQQQTGLLSENGKQVQSQLQQLMGMGTGLAAARPLYLQLKSAIASAKAQAEAAEDTVMQQFDAYAQQVHSLDTHLDWVDWMLKAIETATFKLLATESGVAAISAVWERPNAEPENGVLFLTDQRILWEDRVGEHQLKVNFPVSQVEEASQEGETEEALTIVSSGDAPFPKLRFVLADPVADEWVRMIGRARSGGYQDDRAEPIDPAEIERVRNAPQVCPNCGAAFTAPILRGQTEIVCEFCGVTTRF